MTASHRNSGPGQHSRALLSKLDDSGSQQLVEVKALTGQTVGEAVRSQHFGLSSHPPKDAEGLVLMLGGGADRAHVLGLEHPPSRPRNLPEGATRLYDKDGNHVHIDGDTIRVQHASRIVLKVGDLTLTINSDGFHFAGGNITHDGRKIDKNHRHKDSVSGPDLTGIPS